MVAILELTGGVGVWYVAEVHEGAEPPQPGEVAEWSKATVC